MLLQSPSFKSVVVNTNPSESLSKNRLSNLYSPHFLRSLEFIYGSEGMISSGGTELIDTMLANIELEGKKILDVGCGLGGVDVYLAKKNDVEITGVDFEPYMILCAEKLLERHRGYLKGKVFFQTLNNRISLKEFSADTFDLVFCKQMFAHLSVLDRQAYLEEMHRVLKPGGRIVTEDWLARSLDLTEFLKKALAIDSAKDDVHIDNGFCYLITPQKYQELIKRAKFKDVIYTDISDKQIVYTQRDIERIKSAKEKFSSELGSDAYDFRVNAWSHFIRAMEHDEILSGIFTAIK
ncbi:MAG: methyltransferase domain-containing protein [Chlamydiales bacterium]|nr:methyltransferase domain-containing protein [Chlamydiales bacterium]